VVLEPVHKKLLALFVGKRSSVALGLVEAGERRPLHRPAFISLKQPKLKVA
jgi:hypothetical protein